ncbi:unnamed protein product [Lathyrus sativus]|nr:unnamed protein product [Lathyrus sativus]
MLQLDAQAVINCINGSIFIADLDAVFVECRLLVKDFNSVILMFISRLCNLDAHHMIGIGKSLGFRTWTSHIPTLSIPPCSVFSSS